MLGMRKYARNEEVCLELVMYAWNEASKNAWNEASKNAWNEASMLGMRKYAWN